MKRKATILVSLLIVALLSASLFAQNNGRKSGKSGHKKSSGQKISGRSGSSVGSGSHHFNGSFGSGQHHFKKKHGVGHNAGWQVQSGHHRQNANGGGTTRIHVSAWGGNGHSSNVHRRANLHHHHHWYGKHAKAQRYFAVPANLYFVKFYNFPYDVCWHNGKYWVCFNGHWMPYSYLIQHHAGAWNWHQAHYRFHSHSAFKKNWKSGHAKLTYSKK